MDRQRHIAFPRDRAFGNVDNRQDAIRFTRAVAQCRKGVCGFAGLADEDRCGAFCDGRFAVAELGRDIDLNRNAGQFFKPVLGGQAGVERRAARDQSDACCVCKIQICDGASDRILIDIPVQGVGQNSGLFGDFLRHEVFVAGFVDACRVDLNGAQFAVHQRASFVVNINALAGQDRAVAFLKIGDAIGHRG